MDVRKFAVWCSAAFLAAAFFAPASAATAQQDRAQLAQMRHDTNASREARIQRTIKDTYSHRWEIYGGGGFLRFRSGEFVQKNNEIVWNLAANYFLSPRLAIVGDARGDFGNGKPLRGDFYTQAPNPQINEYTFTGGVNYRFYAKEKVALSVQGLGGVGWGMFSGGAKGLTYQQIGFWQDAIRPAFIGNFDADYNFFPNLAFRVQPTYVGTTFGGTVQHNLGLNMGLVYRFGHQ